MYTTSTPCASPSAIPVSSVIKYGSDKYMLAMKTAAWHGRHHRRRQCAAMDVGAAKQPYAPDTPHTIMAAQNPNAAAQNGARAAST